MIKKLFIILSLILLIPMVVGVEESLGSVKKGDCFNLVQTCANCSYVNITNVLYPNKTLALNQVTMTKSGSYYYYYYCNTPINGEYIVNGIGDVDGVDTIFSYNFYVTENGNPSPEGIIIIFYVVGFFLIFGWFLYTLFLNVSGIGNLNTDLRDVLFSLVGYLILIGYYYFSLIFFDFGLITDINEWLIYIGAFTHGFLSFIGFFLSYFVGEIKKVRTGGY